MAPADPPHVCPDTAAAWRAAFAPVAQQLFSAVDPLSVAVSSCARSARASVDETYVGSSPVPVTVPVPVPGAPLEGPEPIVEQVVMLLDARRALQAATLVMRAIARAPDAASAIRAMLMAAAGLARIKEVKFYLVRAAPCRAFEKCHSVHFLVCFFVCLLACGAAWVPHARAACA